MTTTNNPGGSPARARMGGTLPAPSKQAGRSIRVLVTASVLEPYLSNFQAVGQQFNIEYRPLAARADVEALEDEQVEVLVASSSPRNLAATPRLRWLQLTAAGVDNLLGMTPWATGLLVTNARGVFGPAIGQYVLLAILHVVERGEERRNLQREHHWPSAVERPRLVGQLARDRTVVIVGYGGVGRESARLLAALGMHVIAVKNRPEILGDDGYRFAGTGDPDGSIPERIVGLDRLGDVVSDADFIVLTLPLTDASRGLFGAELIARMRRDAWLVNTARGMVVDEAQLTAALYESRIGGAVLDVFANEPLPADSPLWDAPNTIVTPHISGGEAHSGHILADLLTQNLMRYARGKPLLNAVKSELQY